MKPLHSGSWLVLQPGPICLQQVYPELMQFKTLVGLGVQATEQVLMASLERMSGWVLNLVHPQEPGSPLLLRGALQQGIRTVQQAQPSAPAQRLFAGLDAMLHFLFQGLMPLRVSSGAGTQDICWGIYSSSLSGWSKAHQCPQILWQTKLQALTSPSAPYGVFAGRLLAGATIAFFEEQYPAAFATLGHPKDSMPSGDINPIRVSSTHTQAIVSAACALVHRGIWNPHSPPHRLWRSNQQWHLLWPLAGTDLQRELLALDDSSARDDSEQWIQRLTAAGCVQRVPEGVVTEEIHPCTGKKVRSVVASGALALTLERLQNALKTSVVDAP